MSASKWENSYFGGFSGVVSDYPALSYPLCFEITPEDSLGWNGRKMILMFLHSITPETCKLELKPGVEVIWGKEYSKFTTKSILRTIDALKDHELFELFNHFKNEIAASIIAVEVDKMMEDAKIKASSRGSTGEDGDEDDTEGDAVSEVLGCIVNALSKIKKCDSYASTSSCNATNPKLVEATVFKHAKVRSSPCVITQEERDIATKFIKDLDLSFDPECDKIHNLVNGKLDPSKIASVFSGNTKLYTKIEENQKLKPFSIVILMDESGSMSCGRSISSRTLDECDHSSDHQHFTVRILYEAFSQIVKQNEIFIYGHTGNDTPEIRVYHEPGYENFMRTIDSQRTAQFLENYDGPVIENVHKRVRNMTDRNILFISISDGYPSGHNYGGLAANKDLQRVIEKCKRDDFLTVGIGIQTNVAKLYQYNITLKNPKDLAKDVPKVLTRVIKTEFVK